MCVISHFSSLVRVRLFSIRCMKLVLNSKFMCARMRAPLPNRKEANQQLVFFYKIVNIYANFECSADAANQANHAKPVSLGFDPA